MCSWMKKRAWQMVVRIMCGFVRRSERDADQGCEAIRSQSLSMSRRIIQ